MLRGSLPFFISPFAGGVTFLQCTFPSLTRIQCDEVPLRLDTIFSKHTTHALVAVPHTVEIITVPHAQLPPASQPCILAFDVDGATIPAL